MMCDFIKVRKSPLESRCREVGLNCMKVGQEQHRTNFVPRLLPDSSGQLQRLLSLSLLSLPFYLEFLNYSDFKRVDDLFEFKK
jgi:hypothetical protein